MATFYSTRQVAELLKIKPDTLSKAIWQGRVRAPQKSPGGQFLWTSEDITRAGWVLLRRDVSDLIERPKNARKSQPTVTKQQKAAEGGLLLRGRL